MYNGIATKVLTGEVRLSYVHLAQPYQNKQGGDPRYQVTLLIPKTDVATKADIDASIQAAYEDGVQNKWKGARPQLKNALIYDGDGCKTDGTPFGAECKGHWVITASSPSTRKPQVVGIDNVNVELAPTDIYSGMYARVTINFFSYDSHGSKGVGCGLGNVLKIRDGETLSGGASAASDFAGIGQSVIPQAAPAQQQGFTQPMNGFAAPAQAAPAQTYAQPAQQAPIAGQAMAMGGFAQAMANGGYVDSTAGYVDPITGQPVATPF
ncbi:DUF2815 family protein [Ruminococcus albus]|uniref:DUF2815 family protein n=1 Tax=Ruminococcus albus TaxID=1264 RepID=A0A1H7MRD4_RUMAL|nr:DUF2815 family protein [Ruminococcus albus]SEL13906.1 Protein of unknown function [Ruminococcus albus]